MGKPTKVVFTAQDFLEKFGTGKSILELDKNANVYSQGEVADTIFYIQKGKVKLTVKSKEDKEAVVGILGPVESRMGAVAWGLRPTPRFPSPLIKPDEPISGIRLSDWLHREAHGEQTDRTRLRCGE